MGRSKINSIIKTPNPINKPPPNIIILTSILIYGERPVRSHNIAGNAGDPIKT